MRVTPVMRRVEFLEDDLNLPFEAEADAVEEWRMVDGSRGIARLLTTVKLQNCQHEMGRGLANGICTKLRFESCEWFYDDDGAPDLCTQTAIGRVSSGQSRAGVRLEGGDFFGRRVRTAPKTHSGMRSLETASKSSAARSS